MRRQRNIKIVATLGPSSSDYDTIKDLHLAGADVFRLNMSHGTHNEIAKRHKIIRQIEKNKIIGRKVRLRLCGLFGFKWW